MTRTRLATLVAVLLLGLTGCSAAGGEEIPSAGGEAGASPGADPAADEQKAQEFVDCMREQGVDLPDPEPNGEGGFDFGVKDSGLNFSDPKLQEALQKCRDKLPGGGNRNTDDPEMQAQMREFAECMRDHGVDVPDPDPSGGFGSAFGDIDRDSPGFKDAMGACKDKLPERGSR